MMQPEGADAEEPLEGEDEAALDEADFDVGKTLLCMLAGLWVSQGIFFYAYQLRSASVIRAIFEASILACILACI